MGEAGGGERLGVPGARGELAMRDTRARAGTVGRWRALRLVAALPWVAALPFAPPSVAVAESLPCREDDRLAEAAATLLLRGEPMAAPELLAAARAHGYDGVSLRARESADEATLHSWLAGLGTANEGELECGEARSEARRLVLAGRRLGRLERDGRRVRGELAAGYDAPQLVLEGADGALSSLPVTRSALAAGVLLPEGPLPRRIQLVGESATGPRPIAELALSGAARAPVRADEPRMRTPAERFAALSAFRRSVGVGAVRENRLLSASAERHAARVCELGKLAHRLDGEDPEVRLRREHVVARGVGEALARAESPERAFQALLDSPVHRLALSRRDFTDAGFGQASDAKGQVCLVVLLASWPRRAP